MGTSKRNEKEKEEIKAKIEMLHNRLIALEFIGYSFKLLEKYGVKEVYYCNDCRQFFERPRVETISSTVTTTEIVGYKCPECGYFPIEVEEKEEWSGDYFCDEPIFMSALIKWECIPVYVSYRIYRCPKCGYIYDERYDEGKKPEPEPIYRTYDRVITREYYYCPYCGSQNIKKIGLINLEHDVKNLLDSVLVYFADKAQQTNDIKLITLIEYIRERLIKAFSFTP